MKKLVFSILFISTLVLSAHLQIASASATPTPTYPYNLKWDIHNIYYYTDSDAQSKYGTPIQNAAHNWAYTGYGNSLYPATRTTDQSNSAIDFHTYSSNDDGKNGYTDLRIFGDADPINAYESNWDWGRISLNSWALADEPDWYIQGVAAHEMGHVFGLDHNNTNPNSLMCQERYGRTVYTVQKVDNDAFKLKHP